MQVKKQKANEGVYMGNNLFKNGCLAGRLRKAAAAVAAMAVLFLPLGPMRFSDAASAVYSDVKGTECEKAEIGRAHV